MRRGGRSRRRRTHLTYILSQTVLGHAPLPMMLNDLGLAHGNALTWALAFHGVQIA